MVVTEVLSSEAEDEPWSALTVFVRVLVEVLPELLVSVAFVVYVFVLVSVDVLFELLVSVVVVVFVLVFVSVDVLFELLVSVVFVVYVLVRVSVLVFPELLVSVDWELPESLVVVVAVEFSLAIDEPSRVSLLSLVTDADCDPASSVVVFVGFACAPAATTVDAAVAISSILICWLFMARIAPL
jgi:hypothetical protein